MSEPTPEELLERRDVLGVRQEIALGQDVEAFMRSPVGRYIQERANEALEEARDELLKVDATDSKAVLKAQAACHVPALVLSWLGEAVEAGRNAERSYIAAAAEANADLQG